MHRTTTFGPLLAGDLIGYSTGLLITVLLLVLALRAARLPGTPVANILFAVSALLWSFGGLAQVLLFAAGVLRDSPFWNAATATHFSGAAIFPIPVLAIWRPYAALSWQKGARFAGVCAIVCAALSTAALWWKVVGSGNIPLIAIHLGSAYQDTFLLLLGAVTSLRRVSTPRAVYLPSMAIVAAACGVSLTMTAAWIARPNAPLGGWFSGIGSHLMLLIALLAFFLFARFRYADVFIRYGVRIMLAGAWASVLAFFVQSSLLQRLTDHAPSPWAMHVFAVMFVANALLLSFTFVDERLSRLVNRLLFHAADYRAANRQLGKDLADLQMEDGIAAAVEAAVREALQLNGALLVAPGALAAVPWPSALLEGEIVELGAADPLRQSLPLPDVEVLVPVTSAGRVTHVLLIAPGTARPGLVMHDLNFLRMAAGQCGNRLDALRREQEAIERQSREAVLLQQVTEAELRALRAQVNPHFLFNSLNTIADLIVRDAARAETMTLRLASAFRHVLAQSARPLTTIREEIEFLRTYLYIEEARFSDRLQVQIDVEPEVAAVPIPSLILQPLVENALRHGLGPKPGAVHLWISAHAQGSHVRLRVEDDGIGPSPKPVSGTAEPNGLGLRNVADRLKTLYRDQASVFLEPRKGGGSCVTILVPRGEAIHAA